MMLFRQALQACCQFYILLSMLLGNKMQPKFEHRNESAWELGDQAYDLDDSIDAGVTKAAQMGIRPGSDGYAAFITAFSRRVRSKQLSPKKKLPKNNDVIAAGAAVVLTPDFLRAAS